MEMLLQRADEIYNELNLKMCNFAQVSAIFNTAPLSGHCCINGANIDTECHIHFMNNLNKLVKYSYINVDGLK